MNKIEYLDKYINKPEVIKTGAYKGCKYIVVMKYCPVVFIQRPNITENLGYQKLKEFLRDKVIGGSRVLDYTPSLPGYIPYVLEEPITNLHDGWMEILFNGYDDYFTGSFANGNKEQRSLDYVLEKICNIIDLMEKFYRVYKEYNLDKAYREIREWQDQIKEAYDEIEDTEEDL